MSVAGVDGTVCYIVDYVIQVVTPRRHRVAVSYQSLDADSRTTKKVQEDGGRRAQRVDYVRGVVLTLLEGYMLLVCSVSDGRVSVYLGQVQITACALSRY